jgi:hypothetical protein
VGVNSLLRGAFVEVGDVVPSGLDLAYDNYQTFCRRIGQKAAAYDAWVRMEQVGQKGSLSKAATGNTDYRGVRGKKLDPARVIAAL